ncbi:MAG: hypothetical protein ABIZ80_19600, partial [Bryobacteraceae bacterium]
MFRYAVACMVFYCAIARAQIITTVAGGSFTFRGNGGPATLASLGTVFGVATDAAGNIYGTDIDNELVVKISPSGVLTVVAGNGARGFGGDGGAATSTQINGASEVLVEANGALLIADTLNHRVRRIAPDGTITTIAGGGPNVLGDNGPAVNAQTNFPTGIALDSAGNFYIADSGKNRVRRVSSSGVISTVAGNGIQGYSGDGGPATSALLNDPRAVEVDAVGNLYISDWGNHRIRRVSLAGTITTLAGTGTAGFSGDGGPASAAALNAPQGLRVDGSGNLYFADTRNNRIRRISVARTITTVAGTGTQGFSGDGGAATAAALDRPVRVALDREGLLLISDSGNA